MERSMFGFGKRNDYYPQLLEHLVEHWGMKTKYASAFLLEYRSQISKLHESGLKNIERLQSSNDPGQRLLAIASEPLDYALVGQAYQAYMTDLRSGRHISSDIELAIWAILSNRGDLLSSIDRGFHEYIETTRSERFPDLFDKVFTP